jgi:hypothetical protein
MHPDVTIMIELQRRWDAVLRGRGEISSARAVIAVEERSASSARQVYASAAQELMSAKTKLKSDEIDLSETETLLTKLQAKSFDAASKRELKAFEAEIASATVKKGNLEESVLSLMDRIADMETALVTSAKELEEKETSAKEKIAAMKERIARFEGIAAENESAFNDGLGGLSQKTKSRFSKIVTSADGKGIVAIDGESCGGCRFTIPFDIRREAAQTDTILSCPHCGKYIYARDGHLS